MPDGRKTTVFTTPDTTLVWVVIQVKVGPLVSGSSYSKFVLPQFFVLNAAFALLRCEE